MGVGEIGGAEVAGKGSTQGGRAEILPEPAMKTSRFETSHAFSVKPNREFVPVNQCEARARTRQLSPLAYELEAGVDEFESDGCPFHNRQLAAPRWV